MPAEQMTSPTPDASQERRTLRARVASLGARAVAALRGNRLLALVLLCGTGVIGTSSVLIAYRIGAGPRVRYDADQLLVRTLSALEAGHEVEASQAVVQLRSLAQVDPTKRGYLPFILGVAVSHEAAQLGNEADRATLFLIAARYLEEARDCGFPPGQAERGRYLLATCLFQSGRYGESVPALRAACKTADRHQYELARALATAYLFDAVPNLKEALRYERLASEDPSLTARQRDEARVRQSRILFRLGDIPGCRELLAAIPPDSLVHDQALILEARMLMWEGDQTLAHASSGDSVSQTAATDKYRQALTMLASAPSEDLAGITSIQAQYLMGVCQRKLGDLPAALAAFVRTRRQHYGTDEALAATLQEAEIHQAQGRPDVALSLYLQVIEQAASAASHDNPWMTLPELRHRLFGAQHRFRIADQHAAARTMCHACRPIFPLVELTEMEAQTYEAWGDSLVREAGSSQLLRDTVTQAEGRAHLRLAADAYRRLAALRYATSHYPDDLWKSGACFIRGQNYEAALTLLEQFLQVAPRKHHPQGLVGMGECHLALGRYHQSLHVLHQCIQVYPAHPESYRARLLASAACIQLNKTDDAKQFLEDNLHHSELTPRSLQWQRSLFAYGELLFQEAMAREAESRAHGVDSQDAHTRQQGLDYLYAAHARYREALEHLEEAVQRYPNAEETNGAWYMIAESYRHAAKLPRKSLAVEVAPADRHVLHAQQQTCLNSAADAYRQLQTRLLTKQEQTQLAAVEQAILRNTYFAHADTLFDLQDYEQAIKAYLAATQRYQQEPAALEAFVQLASCYRLLHAPAEARGTLLQAQAALARMQPDADFTRTTRYNRDEWNEIIGWLAQL